MKKIKYILTMVLCVLCSLVFVACGNDNSENAKSKQYTISLETSTDYELFSDKLNAEAFEEVSISVTLKTVDKKLVAVKYGEKTVSQNSDGKFTFLMPTTDVTVSAVLEEYQEVLASNDTSRPFVSFDSANTKTIVPNTGDIELYAPMNASYMTILRKSISSSNQNAIPTNAIKVEGRITSSSNVIIGADITIDTSKVSLGYSWIEINFTNGNSPSQKGKLVFKLTVAESIAVETWTEYLELDISSLDQEYQDGNFYVGLSDLDHVPGMTSESYQYFRDIKAENGKLKITMEYAVAHRYQISVGVIDQETDRVSTWFNLMESIGAGNSSTGYNQYKSKKLTFIQNGYTLTISVI